MIIGLSVIVYISRSRFRISETDYCFQLCAKLVTEGRFAP